MVKGERGSGGERVRAVLFDAVGTLIRPYPSVGSVYSRAAAPCGVRCRPSVLDRHFRTAGHFRGAGAAMVEEGRRPDFRA